MEFAHFRECLFVGDGACGIGRVAGAAIGAVGVACENRNSLRIHKQACERQHIFLIGTAAACAAHGDGQFAAREDRKPPLVIVCF